MKAGLTDPVNPGCLFLIETPQRILAFEWRIRVLVWQDDCYSGQLQGNIGSSGIG